MLDATREKLSLVVGSVDPWGAKDLFQYLVFSPKDFEPDASQKIRAELLGPLIGYIKAQELLPTRYKLDFGPTYYTSLLSDYPTRVRVVLLKELDKRKGNDRVEKYALIATDPNDQIIGFRRASLEDIQDGDKYASYGYVYTAIRSKGISTGIDSAHADFLQRLATQYHAPIEWQILNANELAVGRAQQAFNESPSEATLATLKTAEYEQERWQAQYGTRGKFDIKENGVTVFQPQISRLTHDFMPEDIESIENIYLKARKNHKFDPNEIERVTSAEKSDLRLRNVTLFQQLMSQYGVSF